MPHPPKLPPIRSIWSDSAAANAREADGMWNDQFGGAPRTPEWPGEGSPQPIPRGGVPQPPSRVKIMSDALAAAKRANEENGRFIGADLARREAHAVRPRTDRFGRAPVTVVGSSMWGANGGAPVDTGNPAGPGRDPRGGGIFGGAWSGSQLDRMRAANRAAGFGAGRPIGPRADALEKARLEAQAQRDVENAKGMWGERQENARGMWAARQEQMRQKGAATVAQTQGETALGVADTQGKTARDVADTQGKTSRYVADKTLEGQIRGFEAQENVADAQGKTARDVAQTQFGGTQAQEAQQAAAAAAARQEWMRSGAAGGAKYRMNEKGLMVGPNGQVAETSEKALLKSGTTRAERMAKGAGVKYKDLAAKIRSGEWTIGIGPVPTGGYGILLARNGEAAKGLQTTKLEDIALVDAGLAEWLRQFQAGEAQAPGSDMI